jgi:hypothetical protein
MSPEAYAHETEKATRAVSLTAALTVTVAVTGFAPSTAQFVGTLPSSTE